MKTKNLRGSWIILAVATVTVISAISIGTSSCKKSETVTAQTAGFNNGTDIIDIGDSAANNPLGYSINAHPNYALDQVHCNIGWQTLFQNNNALLTGRFNTFNTGIHFDEANPKNTVITSWVDLSSFNTGEPGRDGPHECGPTNMGIQWDTINGTPAIIASTDTAWFTSAAGSCESFGSGYIAHGNLNFRQITHPVDLFFTYNGQHQEVSNGDTTEWVGFIGQFTIRANTWFGVSLYDAINDSVTVLVNYNAYYNNAAKNDGKRGNANNYSNYSNNNQNLQK